MPELPDITIYIERLRDLVKDQPLEEIRFASPFFLRTAKPPIRSIHGEIVRGFERIGKRIVFAFDNERFLVLHLMIAGRLHWRKRLCKIPFKKGLAAFDFPNGSLLITEPSTKKRASLHFVKGRQALESLNPGGLEVLSASIEEFRNALIAENHTLKRALTDPHIFSGIGNAYSDEILHRARMSPLFLTDKLNDDQIECLFHAACDTLRKWIQRLRNEVGNGFPEKVTAFRKEMAVHGRFGKACPQCGSLIQRIRYVANETNYCPTCQTGGRLLADRAMSRLLKKDWPRSIKALEIRKKNLSQNAAINTLRNNNKKRLPAKK